MHKSCRPQRELQRWRSRKIQTETHCWGSTRWRNSPYSTRPRAGQWRQGRKPHHDDGGLDHVTTEDSNSKKSFKPAWTVRAEKWEIKLQICTKRLHRDIRRLSAVTLRWLIWVWGRRVSDWHPLAHVAVHPGAPRFSCWQMKEEHTMSQVGHSKCSDKTRLTSVTFHHCLWFLFPPPQLSGGDNTTETSLHQRFKDYTALKAVSLVKNGTAKMKIFLKYK